MSSTQSLPEAFDLSGWRKSVKARRELVRSLIRLAVEDKVQLEVLIDDLKRKLRFGLMDDADKNLFHVTVHDMRTIVGAWSRLSHSQKAAFLSGVGAPSSLAKTLRKDKI